jgi:hypothetical protein
MVILRILGALLVVTLGASFLVFVITRDKRWLRFAWQVFKTGLIISLILVILFFMERFLIAI